MTSFLIAFLALTICSAIGVCGATALFEALTYDRVRKELDQ
jgi:hypothetical protein